MNTPRTLAVTLLALCLVGMLVLPAAAAQAARGQQAGKIAKIDQGMKDDLWTVHKDYRLKIYDLHVEKAGAVIGVLDEHGCDVTGLQATLGQINEQRDPLKTALDNKDRDALKTINQQLKDLWQEFLKGFRTSVRSCSGSPSGGVPGEQTEA
jgi:hypothetical protein